MATKRTRPSQKRSGSCTRDASRMLEDGSTNELKSLIKRFATRENQCCRKGGRAYRWRSYRLKAVVVYERRFERVPEIFRGWKLPPMKSYYVREGRYVWPEHGEPGRLAFPRSQ
jgi:hypothetical protein